MERLTRPIDPKHKAEDSRYGEYVVGAYQGIYKGHVLGQVTERLAFYENAADQGRLFILPCSSHASYFEWKDGDDIPSQSRFDGVEIDEGDNVLFKTWRGLVPASEVGKSLFLTYAEAKAHHEMTMKR